MSAGTVAVLPGDGVGPEVVAAAVAVLDTVAEHYGLRLDLQAGLAGGAAYRAVGHPLPDATLALCDRADAILFGSVGDPEFDSLPRHLRPEQSLSILRKRYTLFANLRPVVIYPELRGLSPLRADLLDGVDMLIVRELAGGIYYGQPRGIDQLESGERRGVNTEVYTAGEVRRIARFAFELARGRRKKVTSVDKANALESGELWRTVVTELAADYPDVALDHLYVDNAAMQLMRRPASFDVILANNIFGDILSDAAAMVPGSIGMVPSASIASGGKKGLYEAIHGSAPDIAGQNKANPIATILSAAMMLRISFDQPAAAAVIEQAVARTLAAGHRTADIARPGEQALGTSEMGAAIAAACRAVLAG